MWPYRLASLVTATLFAALAPALVVACLDTSSGPASALRAGSYPRAYHRPRAAVFSRARRNARRHRDFGAQGRRCHRGGAVGILGISALGSTYTWSGGVWVNAALTLAGWLSYFGGVSLCGALGALAGLVFWFTLESARMECGARGDGGTMLSSAPLRTDCNLGGRPCCCVPAHERRLRNSRHHQGPNLSQHDQ